MRITEELPRAISGASRHVSLGAQESIMEKSTSNLTTDGGPYYVYALVDPLTYRATGSQLLSVFYIGKGVKNRAEQHEQDERKAIEAVATALAMNGSKAERIRIILGCGEHVSAIMLASGFATGNDAYRTEALAMELIGRLLSAHGMAPLTNAIPGHGQSQGMSQLGGLSSVPRVRHLQPKLVPRQIQGEPEYEWRTVREGLQGSTSRRAAVATILQGATIIVKGTADLLITGSHPRADSNNLPTVLFDHRTRIDTFESGLIQGTQFDRRGYDPDDPWTDGEARERATRYWPIAARTVERWLTYPDAMPEHLLLTIPGSRGRTTVRYAWTLRRDGNFEYYPETSRWGLPLGQRILTHPALGCSLFEDRGGKEVQVLANYASGFRVIEQDTSDLVGQ